MNEEDLKKRAFKELMEIRDTGKFNMFMDAGEVLMYANRENMFNLVSFVENDREKYMELLKYDPDPEGDQ